MHKGNYYYQAMDQKLEEPLNINAKEGEATSWQRDFAGEYDYCIVFPAENGDFTKKGSGYIRCLKKLGLELFVYKNIKPDKEIFVLIRAPLEKLRAFADNIDFEMRLESEEIKKIIETGNPEEGISPVVIQHRPDITKLQPYENIYGKYSRNVDEKIYWREPGDSHPFRDIIRLKLVALILESRMPDGGENLKIRRYIKNGWLLACYPLHNRQKTEHLEKAWSHFPFKSQPLDQIKEYFGEKIGLYFTFMQHFTNFLAIPAFIGIPLQIAVFILNDYSAAFLPAFSFFIALWAVTMLEFWKRREKATALHWGTIDFESNEVDRPDFKGQTIKSYIDGSDIRYFSTKTRSKFLAQSFAAIVGLILLVVGVVASIYVIRSALTGPVGDSNAQTIASIANAVQIQVLNYVYSFLANALSERENHRTATQYEDSMIMKIFVFQFVNSYASFFYLAFIAEWRGECPENGCMPTLAINLAIIFGSRLVSGNILELLIPYLSYQYKYKAEMAKSEGKISRPEREFLLDPYDMVTSSLEDYAEIAIQFGYTALFVSALPFAAAFAWISNIVEIKGDSYKLLNLHQRPVPKGCEDIGTWQDIFLMMSTAAVITNAGLTVFTMDTFDRYTEPTRYWIFILFQWVCFGLQQFIMAIIPDVPEEIEIQLERTDFIVRKIIDKVADDNCEDVPGADNPVEFQTYPSEGGRYSHTHMNPMMTNMY